MRVIAPASVVTERAAVTPSTVTGFAPAVTVTVTDAGTVIEGYASLFGLADQGGDKVMPGAYAASL